MEEALQSSTMAATAKQDKAAAGACAVADAADVGAVSVFIRYLVGVNLSYLAEIYVFDQF